MVGTSRSNAAFHAFQWLRAGEGLCDRDVYSVFSCKHTVLSYAKPRSTKRGVRTLAILNVRCGIGYSTPHCNLERQTKALLSGSLLVYTDSNYSMSHPPAAHFKRVQPFEVAVHRCTLYVHLLSQSVRGVGAT